MQFQAWNINIGLGAPPQPLILALDTGVADTWVNSATSAACASGCAQQGGAFNSGSSAVIGQTFAYTYRDGTQATGDYVSDTLTIASQTLEGFEFVVGTSTIAASGRLGLSYPASQVLTSAGASSYPNIYDILISKGLINSKGFSLWLDGPTSGQILFGGVNAARYSGDLGVVPIQQVDGAYKDFAISLSKINLSRGDKSVDVSASLTAVNVVLNSGSLFTFLPLADVQQIYQALGVTAVAALRDKIPIGFTKCNLADSGIVVNFFFGSVKIAVPAEAFLLAYDLFKKTDTDGNQVCALKIRPASDGKYALTFFETAYIVFDLTKNEISLAQAKKGVTDNNIVEIGQSPANPSGGGDTGNTGGTGGTGGTPDVPNLPGLTFVDPTDYALLDPNGSIVTYEDFLKEGAGGGTSPASGSGGGTNPDDGSGGKFIELDPNKIDFSKLNPDNLIPYDEFVAELGGASEPTTSNTPDTGANNNQPQTPATTGGDQQLFPDDPGTAGTGGTPPATDPGTAGTVGTAGTAGTAGTDPNADTTTTTSTTVVGGGDSVVYIDPATGLPVDPSLLTGGVDPYADPYYDPYADAGVFKRVPAPAALRKRRV